MATRNTITKRHSPASFRIAHLFRDPVLQRVFATAEKDPGTAPALPAPAPRTLDGGAAVARILEDA